MTTTLWQILDIMTTCLPSFGFLILWIVSPCDKYWILWLFWPCPEVVTISDTYCTPALSLCCFILLIRSRVTRVAPPFQCVFICSETWVRLTCIWKLHLGSKTLTTKLDQARVLSQVRNKQDTKMVIGPDVQNAKYLPLRRVSQLWPPAGEISGNPNGGGGIISRFGGT